MTKEIISFLKPRLALLLAVAMLISMMPLSAFAAETTAPETTWESQVTGSFKEAASNLESYTHYSVVDGVAVPETVTIDTTATLGSKENPIAISSPEELILFGQTAAGGYAATSNPTYGKYYILTQDTYDMGAHSMLALSASVYYPSGGISYFGFYGTLIGNGATIQNAYIVGGTRTIQYSNTTIQPALFSALNGRIWDLTLDSCTASGGSGTMGMLYAATNGLSEDAIINCNIIDGQILPGSGISTISLLGSAAVNSQADVTLGCDYTLRSNLTLNSGETLTIPEGVTLTVPARRTLTMGSGSSLINNGKLVLAEGGSIVNNGGTATCGENSGHSYLEGICRICGNGCSHAGDATCAEQATCTLCGQVYQLAHTPNEAGDACDVCGAAMYRVSKYEEDDRLRFLLFQGPDYAFEGQDYVGRIIVDPDYGVTMSTDFNFEVWVDGVQITEYRFCNTVLTVPAHLVTGDILITCDGDLQKEPDTPLGSCPGIIGGSLSHDGFVWAADYSSCTIRACCGLCDEIFEYTHTPGVTNTEATCTQTGKTVHSVSVRDLSDSKEVILPIDESNHDYVDGICTRCGEKLYPIFLGGVQISDDNASDILGDGTASYDAQTGTLTLNGASVDVSALDVPALQITGGVVTLVLQGTNALTGSVQVQSSTDEEGNTTWYGEPAVSIAEGAALIITGDETATLTLVGNDFAYTANDHIPSASSISGGSLTVAGGTVTTVNGIRMTGDYSQTGGSVDAGFLEAQNVTVSDGILNARGYSGIEPRYLDSSAGGIHGIFARETITVSGGTVTSFSGVVGHNGDYRGAHQVTGETITTHGLYALESISITGGSVTSTGCQGGYVIGDAGELVLGNWEGEEWVGPSAGAALEAPEWSISEEATFICGSDASHRDGIATCVDPLACQFCGVVRGELDAGNHAGPYTVQYKWYPHTDGTCYVYAELYCDGCGECVDDTSDYAELIEDVAPVNCQNPGSRTWSFTCTFNGEQYSEIHTETIYNDVHIVFDGNGFCTSCGGYQKPTVDPGEDAEWDYDDVYLIYNAGQLYWFADYVNNVNNNVTGKLMTDIDLNPGYTFHGDGTYTGGDSPRMWTPIGTGYPCYAGSFDGNGFTVSGAYAVSEGSYVGLFGNTDYNYTIENLGITNSYFKGADHVGGLIGYAYTTVKNCYVTDTVYVSGDYDTAAFIGYNGGEITNCYAMADTFVASNYGSCYNCYAMTEGDGTTALTAEDFISGKAAYLLQSGVAEDGYYDENDNWVTFIPEIWGQSIGTDSYPVLKGAKVYQVTNCKNETVYSNTDVSGAHTEQTVAGKAPTCTESGLTDGVICSVCGETLTAQEEISALGHGHTEGISYEEGDGTHDVFCDDCYTTIEWNVKCTYSEDTHTCICGNVETFTIEWYDFGTFKSETYKYGETVNGPEPVSEVTEQGKNTFLFWYDLNDGTEITLPMPMPAKNLQLQAAYSYTGWAGVIGTDYYTYWIDSMEVQGWFNVNENNEPVGEGEGTRYYAGEDYQVVNNVTLIDGIYYAFDRETGAFLSDYIGFYEARNGDCYYVTNGIAVAHNGHTEQTVTGFAATCTETGLTDGVKCSVCGETITAQEEIPATGHSIVNGGCENCDLEIQVSIPGSFNGWDTTAWIMTRNEDGTYTYQVRLESGSYTFKIMDDGIWLGNNGTINDHTYGYEWIFSDAGDCILSASGGTYTFTYNINTKGLKVEAVLDHVHDYDLTFTWSDYYTTCVAAGSCGCGNSVSENCSIAKTLENGKLSFTATYDKYSDTVTVNADHTNVIYVDVSAMGWTNVNAYYWMSTSYQGVINWPGIPMTHVRDSVYCIEVPADCDRIIFNNGSAQTDDLNMPVNGENIAVVKSGNTTDFGYMEPLTYTLTFTDDPEFIMADWSYSITKPYGAPITEEDLAALEAAIPEVENYNLVNWYLTDGTWTDIPATMPNCDLTFYGYWEGVRSTVYFYSDPGMSEDSYLFASEFLYDETYSDLETFVLVNCLEDYTPEGYHVAAIKYADGTNLEFPYVHGAEGFNLYVEFAINACEIHTEETVPGYAATCTEPGLTDGVKCSVCGETIIAQEEIPAGHSYEDDVCTVCGHIGVPVKLDSASLSFKEKIHYDIFFSLGLDETVDLSDMGLIMFDSLNADGTVDDAIAIYSGAVEMDGKYMIATDGVHAKRLGDTIYFRVYAKLADGSYVYSKTVQYSAVTYAEHILAGDQPESAKALVVAMLNYGAAAQKFFGYNTDNLVNAFLTEEQKALPEQYRDDMVNTVPVVAAEKQGVFANNKGFSKRVPAVSFEGAFEINYFFTPAYAPVDGITLYYWTEADFDANEVLTVDNATGFLKLEGTGMEQYRGDIGGIAAKNLSQNVYVAAVYFDGTTTWTSGVLGYSIGAYCSSLSAQGGTIADLAMATAVYGYHAKQFFG